MYCCIRNENKDFIKIVLSPRPRFHVCRNRVFDVLKIVLSPTPRVHFCWNRAFGFLKKSCSRLRSIYMMLSPRRRATSQQRTTQEVVMGGGRGATIYIYIYRFVDVFAPPHSPYVLKTFPFCTCPQAYY